MDSLQQHLDFALSYATRGWAVFPCYGIMGDVCACRKKGACNKPGKHPRTQTGFHAASTDKTKIRRWFRANPDANIGIATGEPSGLVVIDVDPPEGQKTIGDLQERLGKLPPSPMAQTGRGWHLVFDQNGAPIGSHINYAPDVDIKGNGGYVIAPPSLHLSGKRYRWEVSPDERAPPQVPDLWLDWLTGRAVTQKTQESAEHPGTSRTTQNGQAVVGFGSEFEDSDLPFSASISEAIGKTQPGGPGERHRCLFKFARRLKAVPELAGKPTRELRPVVREWHKKALPKIQTKEWDATMGRF